MAMGELTLRLPRRVGVRLTLDRFLASFDPAGLVRAGNGFQSPGYATRTATAGHRRDAAVGGVKVGWADERFSHTIRFVACPPRDPGLRPRHLVRLRPQSLRHGRRRRPVPAVRIVHLPEPLQVLANPVVLGIALTLFLVEFIADKIPYVDSAWDALHTFIRPPAAALLSYSAFAGSVPEEWKLAAALLAGSVALTSHGAKASTRAAANASPSRSATGR